MFYAAPTAREKKLQKFIKSSPAGKRKFDLV